VVLGLAHPFGPFHAECSQVVTQANERAIVQKPGQVIRSIRQEFAASDSYEKLEELPLRLLDRGSSGGFRQCDVNKADRRGIASD
jgi:hypothetical protein